MKGIVASTANWDAVVKLAGDKVGHMDIEGGGDAVTKTLYVNKRSLGQSSKTVSKEVYASRLAAADSVREKFRQEFQAQYPMETQRVLNQFVQKKFENGFRGSDVQQMHDSMQKAIQCAEANEHFQTLDIPAALKTSSMNYYVNDLRKTPPGGDEMKGVELNELKLLSGDKAAKLRQSSYDRALAHLSGLALHSTEFSQNEFKNYNDLAKAVKSDGLIGAAMAGMSGRAVFLAPEVLNHRDLEPVKKIITLSVLAETLTNDNLSEPTHDATRDAHLALKLLGRDFEFSEAAIPGVLLRQGVQERLLDIILSELPPIDDMLAGLHRPAATLEAAQRKMDDLKEAAKSEQKRLDVSAPDGEKTAEVNKPPKFKNTSPQMIFGQALAKKRDAIFGALQRSVDAELQQTGSPGGVIKTLLDDLAGEKGKNFAKKAAHIREAGMAERQNARTVLK
ncbi:MAG: hypothetical protein ACR652_11930 [Methylocystis sp.]|uniref:hypothetical protein n=1 Tax=Methylocystis sp. TaxID=1911079 RepID=UPI003DA4F945